MIIFCRSFEVFLLIFLLSTSGGIRLSSDIFQSSLIFFLLENLMSAHIILRLNFFLALKLANIFLDKISILMILILD